jgi:hypothetical protein
VGGKDGLMWGWPLRRVELLNLAKAIRQPREERFHSFRGESVQHRLRELLPNGRILSIEGLHQPPSGLLEPFRTFLGNCIPCGREQERETDPEAMAYNGPWLMGAGTVADAC